MRENRAVLSFRHIPGLEISDRGDRELLWSDTAQLSLSSRVSGGSVSRFACVSMAEKRMANEFAPSPDQIMKNPLAALAYVPSEIAMFLAESIAEAAAKTVTAPLDTVKIFLQTHGVRVGQESAKKTMGLFEAVKMIVKEERIKGYRKGNIPRKDGRLSVVGRFAAGAGASMASTFVNFEDTCKGFLEVAKEAVLQIICVIFEDPGVQEGVVEIYHREWCEGLVTEDLVATFGEYFKEVKIILKKDHLGGLLKHAWKRLAVYVDHLLKQRNNIKEETIERMRLDEEKVESRVKILSDLRDNFTLVYANILEHQPDCPPEVVEKLVGLREGIPRKDAKEVIQECKEIYENSLVDCNPHKAGFVFPKVKCLQSSKGSLWRKLT